MTLRGRRTSGRDKTAPSAFSIQHHRQRLRRSTGPIRPHRAKAGGQKPPNASSPSCSKNASRSREKMRQGRNFRTVLYTVRWCDPFAEALRGRSRERPDHARRQSSDTAVASGARAAGSGLFPRTGRGPAPHAPALGDRLHALPSSIPHLTRSALLPSAPWRPAPAGHRRRQTFERYPIGRLHIGIAEVQTTEGKPGQVRGRPTRCDGGQKHRTLEAVSCRVQAILTDNGMSSKTGDLSQPGLGCAQLMCLIPIIMIM
ncbi:hypothetical protein PARU111607_09995 [Palleronia rufa]